MHIIYILQRCCTRNKSCTQNVYSCLLLFTRVVKVVKVFIKHYTFIKLSLYSQSRQ